MTAVVRKTVTVAAPIAHTFAIFTRRFDLWWPKTHRVGKSSPFTVVLEPHEGGRWFERGQDGSECDWGRVLAYSPPTHVAFSWQLDANYRFDPDPSRASRVDVSFFDDDGARTRVELVHSELQRHGADWAKIHAAVGSQGGWIGIMDAFALAATASLAEGDK